MRAQGLQNAFKNDREGAARMVTTVSALDQPFDEAIAFFREKAAIPTKSWRDVWDAAHSKMFMVAGANTEALVGDFQSSIAKALEQGTTLEDFRKDFDQIVKRHGWSYKGDRGWRTRTIFETNLRTAHAAGRYAQLTDPDTLEAFPGWQYNHSGALHPRLDHKSWNGTVLAATDPAWKTMYPPNGFGCGCFVTPVSMPALRRLGKKGFDSAPDLDQLGTDQPRGVDPSFAYNPGEAWLRQTAPGPTAVSAREANAAAFVNSALRGKWPDGSWTPVGVHADEVASAIGVEAGTELRLLADTIRTNVGDGIDADAYATVPRQIVKDGKVEDRGEGHFSISKTVNGNSWRASVKVERDGTKSRVLLDKLIRETR
jgi:hypothetical protein